MSTEDCLRTAGVTLKEQAELFNIPIDEASDQTIKQQMDAYGFNAERMTKEDLFRASEERDVQLYRNEKQAYAQIKMKKYFKDYKGKPKEALSALLGHDPNEVGGALSVENMMRSTVHMAHAELDEFLASMSPKLTDQMMGIFTGETGSAKQRELMRDVARELHGTSTKNSDATGFSEVVSKVLDNLENQLQFLQGYKAKLKDWGMPTRHDTIKVGNVSKQEWSDYIWSKLDVKRMMKENPDLMDESQLRWVIEKVYDTISTDGLSKLDLSPVQGKTGKYTRIPPALRKVIAQEHQEHRFLKFKDGDAWVDYQDKFGSGSLYQTITDHIQNRAREIALSEQFGPHYENGFAYAKRLAVVGEGDTSAANFADSMYTIVKGMDGHNPSKAANLLRAGRDWQVATKLGTAVVSAQTDHSFIAQTALYNGLSPTRATEKYLRQLSSKEARQEAMSLGLTAEFALDRTSAALEYNNAYNTGKAKQIADVTMKATGMEAHTVASRQAFGMEFYDGVTRALNSKEIPKNLLKALERYGITSKDMQKIKGYPRKTMSNGLELVDPTQWTDRKIQQKFMGMVLQETDFAVVTPGIRERAIVSLGTKPGTVVGEVVRALTQFTTFPVTVHIKHHARMVKGNVEGGSRLQGMAVGLSLAVSLGAVVVQAKQMLSGNEMLETDNPEFWLKAMDQGGYFGLVGSYLLQEGGFNSAWSGGPLFGTIQDLGQALVLGNIQAIREGRDTSWSPEAIEFIQKNLPGNNIWYLKTALNRVIFDQLQRAANPQYDKEMRAKARQMRRDTGQEMWWAPGDITPGG